MPRRQPTHRHPPVGLEQWGRCKFQKKIVTVETEPYEIAIFTSQKRPEIGDFIWLHFIYTEHLKVKARAPCQAKTALLSLSWAHRRARIHSQVDTVRPHLTRVQAGWHTLTGSLSGTGAHASSPALAVPRTHVVAHVLVVPRPHSRSHTHTHSHTHLSHRCGSGGPLSSPDGCSPSLSAARELGVI